MKLLSEQFTDQATTTLFRNKEIKLKKKRKELLEKKLELANGMLAIS